MQLALDLPASVQSKSHVDEDRLAFVANCARRAAIAHDLKNPADPALAALAKSIFVDSHCVSQMAAATKTKAARKWIVACVRTGLLRIERRWHWMSGKEIAYYVPR